MHVTEKPGKNTYSLRYLMKGIYIRLYFQSMGRYLVKITVGFFLFIYSSNPGFFDHMFHSPTGRASLRQRGTAQCSPPSLACRLPRRVQPRDAARANARESTSARERGQEQELGAAEGGQSIRPLL